MPKSIKRPSAFQIPTVEEVIEFMDKSMKDWPRSFSEYYGTKFWQSYQAKGWRISGTAMMKDFHAAFWARWANIPYLEDKKVLDKCLQSLTHKIALDERRRKSAGLFAVVEGSGPSPLDRYLDHLDDVFIAYKTGAASNGQLRAVSEWLNRNNLPGVTNEQMDRIVEERGNDGDLGLILIAGQFFKNLIAKNWTVRQYFNSKTRSSGEQIKTA